MISILLHDKRENLLKQYVSEDGNTNKIIKVITQIKDIFLQRLNTNKLAKGAKISESSLHHDF